MLFGKHFGDSQWSPSTPGGELDEYRVSSISIPRQFYVDVSKNRGTPNGWFIMENHIKMDDLEGTPIFGNIHIGSISRANIFPKVSKVTVSRSYWFFSIRNFCWWFRNPANQLRLVVYPTIYKVLYIPGGCLGFLNHQQLHPEIPLWSI